MAKQAITDGQYGQFHKRLDDFVTRMKIVDGGIPFDLGMKGLQALIVESWSWQGRFNDAFRYQWIPDDLMILAWNLMAGHSDMVAAVLPEKYKIVATLWPTLYGAKGSYILWEGLPPLSMDDNAPNMYAGMLVNLGNYPKVNIPEEQPNWPVPRQEIEKTIAEFAAHLDFMAPPSKWIFMTGDGHVFWLEEPSKSHDELIGETIRLMAQFLKEIRLAATDTTELEKEIDAALAKGGMPEGKTSIGDFFDGLAVYVEEWPLYWEELNSDIIKIRNKWIKD